MNKCTIKKSFGKENPECEHAREDGGISKGCDLCPYLEKYMDLVQDARMLQREFARERGELD